MFSPPIRQWLISVFLIAASLQLVAQAPAEDETILKYMVDLLDKS